MSREGHRWHPWMSFGPTKPGPGKYHVIQASGVFEVHNNAPYTVWAAATPVGGGKRLERSQS
uniref:Antiviral protein gp22 (Fragments) n=1 Tax=Nicotiana tabacum TaxID=4097 RepID=Q7M1L3_TOBAC